MQKHLSIKKMTKSPFGISTEGAELLFNQLRFDVGPGSNAFQLVTVTLTGVIS